ncbi:hypothetical protein [Brevibacterium luteolum]|uniref:hypothetical protein n=1 Tax=Brevibacterium luteolum TaxID=199591 RepID=UPI001C231958|nr:hypothetical protein [Brevibacterium luteolum]MBU8578038.1 hypothetical protein [Brevibacterium luteolum]
MALNPGKRQRKLPDMSVFEPEQYTPPDPDDCEIDEYTFVVSGQLKGHYRIHHMNGKVVDFSIALLHDQSIRDDRNLARSDCDHGCIHRHLYLKDGSDALGGHTGKGVIAIPPGEAGYDVVHHHYDREYEWVIENSAEHLDRWRRS